MKRRKSKTSLKDSKNTKIVLGIFALILISAAFVYAGSTLAGKAFIIIKHTSEDVSAYSDCIKVTNNLAWDLFIPLNTSLEWNSFKNAVLPSGLTKGACAVACDPTCYTCGSTNECGDPCGCPSGYNCVSGECLEDTSCYDTCDSIHENELNTCSSSYSNCMNSCVSPCRIDPNSSACNICQYNCDDKKQQCDILADDRFLTCLEGCPGGGGGGGGSVTPPIPLPN